MNKNICLNRFKLCYCNQLQSKLKNQCSIKTHTTQLFKMKYNVSMVFITNMNDTYQRPAFQPKQTLKPLTIYYSELLYAYAL